MTYFLLHTIEVNVFVKKVIYAYFNDDDLWHIQCLMLANGIFVYDEKRQLIDKVRAITDGVTTFYLSTDGNDFVALTPCFFSAKYLQCGLFSVEDEMAVAALRVFFFVETTHSSRVYVNAK